MLQFDALRPDTLDVLRLTMAEPLLNDFILVGGTALALHYGHRISEDIDLFRWDKFDVDLLLAELALKQEFSVKVKTPIGAHLFFSSVKTDLVYFPAAPIRDLIVKDGVRLLSPEDLAGMKLNAIANRGVKKDFYDLFFLMEQYSLPRLIELFSEKFKTQDVFGLVRSLSYFADADNNDEVVLLKNKSLTWEKVKQHISSEVRKELL
jgi:predicted nucleotidyltransferase component of viral defense system